MTKAHFSLSNMLHRPNTEVCHLDWVELAYLVPVFQDEGGVGMADFSSETTGQLGTTKILHGNGRRDEKDRAAAQPGFASLRGKLQAVNGRFVA